MAMPATTSFKICRSRECTAQVMVDRQHDAFHRVESHTGKVLIRVMPAPKHPQCVLHSLDYE